MHQCCAISPKTHFLCVSMETQWTCLICHYPEVAVLLSQYGNLIAAGNLTPQGSLWFISSGLTHIKWGGGPEWGNPTDKKKVDAPDRSPKRCW